MKQYTIRLAIGTEAVEGRGVKFKGLAGVELFYHKDMLGKYQISEASTGYRFTQRHWKLKDARKQAQEMIDKKGCESIKRRIGEVPALSLKGGV